MIFTALTFLQKASPFKETTLKPATDCVKMVVFGDETLIFYRTNGTYLYKVTLERVSDFGLPKGEYNIPTNSWATAMQLKAITSISYEATSDTEGILSFNSPSAVTSVKLSDERYMPSERFEQVLTARPVALDAEALRAAYLDTTYLKNVFSALDWLKSKTRAPIVNRHTISSGVGVQIVDSGSPARVYFYREKTSPINDAARIKVEGCIMPMKITSAVEENVFPEPLSK